MMWQPRTWSVSFSTICLQSDSVSPAATTYEFDESTAGQFESHNLVILHSLGILVGLGSRVGSEWVLSNLVLDTGLLEFLLVLTNPRDLWVGVNDRWNGVVVDVTMTVFDDLDSGDTLLLSLVGKHRSEGDISDRFDTLGGRVQLVVDDNSSSLVGLDTNVLKSETLSNRSSTDGHEHNIGVNLEIRIGKF